jgi:hypothetical protein
MLEKSNEEFKEYSKKLTTEYLEEYPENCSQYCKTKEKQLENIEKCFNKIIAPNDPTTKPDTLVSEMLETLFNHDAEKRIEIQKQYNDQKQTEMMIGEFLERYISKEGRSFGWAFSGECIKAVDFIKKNEKEWIKLQVKNSDNTENSSAKAIRDDTPIIKWFRRFSSPKKVVPYIKKDGKLSKRGLSNKEYNELLHSGDYKPFTRPEFNWDNFPDNDLRKILSEKEFRKFISEEIELLKNTLINSESK